MYHLLQGQHKPRVYQSVYYPLNERREPEAGTISQPGKREPHAEMGATQEQEPAAETDEAEQEPVYTVIGEVVEPTKEPGVTTIVVDPHPALLGERQDEETNEPEQDDWPLSLTMRRRLAPLGWSLVGMALVLVGVLVVMLVLPWWEPSATVTIVPLTQAVNTSFTAQLVPANADLARQQIQGRQLATLTMSQNKTVPTTGSDSQPAQAAQGWITLYNALPTAQIIPTGTLIVGQDGVQVTTDSTVTIPAANLPTAGQVSVSAHATEPGPAGNIAPLDINGPCCRADVLAKNSEPFTRGQNARSFQAVSAQDIKGASTTLETSLTQDATVAYQSELQNGESLITPVSCNPQINADYPQGSEATQVTVNVSEACQGIAYNAAQVQTLVSQAINQQMQGSQAEHYQLDSRSLYIQVMLSSTNPGDVPIQAHGILAYHWNKQQQSALAALIAGKSEAQATALLAQQPGISVSQPLLCNSTAGTPAPFPPIQAAYPLCL